MDIKLSVIVPVYNAMPYLHQCIDSIIGQSLKEIEIILIDDGSTDESGAVCDAYAKIDNRIVVLHQENKGPIAARQLGVLTAKAEYVIFVDADDFIEKDAYVLALSDMEKGIDVISFGITRYHAEDYQRHDTHNYKEGIYDRVQMEKSIFPTMIWNQKTDMFGLDPSLCTKVIKRKLLLWAYERVGKYAFHYGEDPATLYPLMMRAQSISIHNASFYNHRQRFTKEVPSYITDVHYFDKLYQLYQFLQECFADKPQLLQQIELYYVYSVRKKLDKKDSSLIAYLFPFDKVEKGERIAIYGAGAVGMDYVRQLERVSYCEVVLWVDQNADKLDNPQIQMPLALQEANIDRVVIAITSDEIKTQIKESLREQGITVPIE